ncbi:MAG: SUF system NifU family Fe-S cluster assembly protein [Bacilli bacterium]|nr:SUF system NifU family Fe-S cluster assembly protein [Bacilli bacterium]
MDKDLKRSIILDNYQDKSNRIRHDNDNNYIKTNTRINTCIDNIDLYIKINNNIIEDISFEGEACVISTSSTNILINLIRGKSIEDAIKIIDNYKKMIDEKEYDKDILGEAIVYDDIYKQPARIKCATLSYDGIYKELVKYRDSK